MPDSAALSRRERQIMDFLYARGRASAADVMEGIHDPPSYSAVRALLRVLEEKGHLTHEQDGPRYVFLPTVPRTDASRSALRQMVSTFFDGSVTNTVAALLETAGPRLSEKELERLSKLIADARREGR